MSVFIWLGASLALPVASRADITLYTSIDEPVARPIIESFQKSSNINVILQTDTEATKSVGLAERVRAEKDHPQADVWWSNEIFHTIRLADENLLAEYDSPSTKDIPAPFKDPSMRRRWAGNGLRARVIVISNLSSFLPQGLADLTKPQLKNHVCIARPTAGTTGGHVAALYILWGPEKAEKYFRDLKANGVRLLGGNSMVADQVSSGKGIMAGLCDNDDFESANRERPVRESMILPDQKTFGTLMIPTTVSLVTGAKNPAQAKKLIDYLLSPEVEKALIEAKFAGWSVRARADRPKAMDIDYREAARMMPEAIRKATAILEGRE